MGKRICTLIKILMWYIIQWNARSLIGNGQELKRFVDEFKEVPELIYIQETWLKPWLDFVIPGYECIRLDRSDRSVGGCATFVRNGLQYRKVDTNSGAGVFGCGDLD